MPIFNVQRSRLRLFLELWGSALAGVLGILLLSGAVPLGVENETPLRGSTRQEVANSKADRLGKRSVTDTTRPGPIAVKPCSVHATYRNREKAFLPYEPVRDDVVPSLHEFTCRWAVGNDLSIDSTRLPKYVRPIGDSLRLGNEVFAYSVKMMEAGKEAPMNALYFVAEIGDSLYYHEIDEHYHNPDSKQFWTIRSLRPLDVSGATSQYVWYEYNSTTEGTKNGHWYRSESWTGHIYTYDEKRGFRYLQWAPIRSAVWKDGELVGAKQWDISVPEAGVMLVEPRLQKGKDMTLEPPEHWLGQHVIDSQATDVEPRPE